MRARALLLAALLAVCVQLSLGDGASQPADVTGAAGTGQVTVHIATTACGAQAADDVIPLLKSIAIHADPANKYFVYVFMNNNTEFH